MGSDVTTAASRKGTEQSADKPSEVRPVDPLAGGLQDKLAVQSFEVAPVQQRRIDPDDMWHTWPFAYRSTRFTNLSRIAELFLGDRARSRHLVDRAAGELSEANEGAEIAVPGQFITIPKDWRLEYGFQMRGFDSDSRVQVVEPKESDEAYDPTGVKKLGNGSGGGRSSGRRTGGHMGDFVNARQRGRRRRNPRPRAPGSPGGPPGPDGGDGGGQPGPQPGQQRGGSDDGRSPGGRRRHTDEMLDFPEPKERDNEPRTEEELEREVWVLDPRTGIRYTKLGSVPEDIRHLDMADLEARADTINANIGDWWTNEDMEQGILGATDGLSKEEADYLELLYEEKYGANLEEEIEDNVDGFELLEARIDLYGTPENPHDLWHLANMEREFRQSTGAEAASSVWEMMGLGYADEVYDQAYEDFMGLFDEEGNLKPPHDEGDALAYYNNLQLAEAEYDGMMEDILNSVPATAGLVVGVVTSIFAGPMVGSGAGALVDMGLNALIGGGTHYTWDDAAFDALEGIAGLGIDAAFKTKTLENLFQGWGGQLADGMGMTKEETGKAIGKWLSGASSDALKTTGDIILAGGEDWQDAAVEYLVGLGTSAAGGYADGFDFGKYDDLVPTVITNAAGVVPDFGTAFGDDGQLDWAEFQQMMVDVLGGTISDAAREFANDLNKYRNGKEDPNKPTIGDLLDEIAASGESVEDVISEGLQAFYVGQFVGFPL